MRDWQECKAEEVFDLVGGYAFKGEDFIASGVPVIKIKNIKANYFSEHEFAYVSEEFLGTRKDKLARPNDLLISMSGNRHDGNPETWVGKVAQYRKNSHHFINQRVGALRVKYGANLNPRFAAYVLSSWPYQEHFISIATSSGGQANLSPSQILGVTIPIPPLQEQKAIAAILGALDDKIELNRRMNTTLEAMARALFKSWFVDFDPVKAKIGRAKMAGKQPQEARSAAGATESVLGFMDAATADLLPSRLVPSPLGDIPEGWNVSNVGSEFDITMGQSPPGETYNESGEGLPFYQGRTDFGFRYPTRRIFCTQPNRVAEAGDTLISVRAPVGDINMAFEKCILGRGVGALRHKSKARSYTYYAIHSIQENIKAFEADGTVFGSINKQDVEKLSIIKPSSESIKEFEKIIQSSDEKILSNIKEILELEKQRDYLLPKLISGDIRIPDAEKFIEGVL